MQKVKRIGLVAARGHNLVLRLTNENNLLVLNAVLRVSGVESVLLLVIFGVSAFSQVFTQSIFVRKFVLLGASICFQSALIGKRYAHTANERTWKKRTQIQLLHFWNVEQENKEKERANETRIHSIVGFATQFYAVKAINYRMHLHFVPLSNRSILMRFANSRKQKCANRKESRATNDERR